MAVLPALKNPGNPVSFDLGKATLKDGTKVKFPKNSIVSGKPITKADGTNLAPGTYESDKGNFTVGNDGLVHQINVKIEPKAEEVVTPTEVVKPVEDLTIKEDAVKEETVPETKVETPETAEVIAEIKPTTSTVVVTPEDAAKATETVK